MAKSLVQACYTTRRPQSPSTDHWQSPKSLKRAVCVGPQGQIFELLDDNGTIAPIVLKAAKKGALISDLEREWGAGQAIAQLAGPDGDLPGFMKVAPAPAPASRPLCRKP